MKVANLLLLVLWLGLLVSSFFLIRSQGFICSSCLFTVSVLGIWAFYHADIRYIFRRLIVWRRAPKLKGATLPPHMRAILHQKVKICRRLLEKLRPKLEERISLFLKMVIFKENGVYFDITDYCIDRIALRFFGVDCSEKHKQMGFFAPWGNNLVSHWESSGRETEWWEEFLMKCGCAWQRRPAS